MNVNFVKYKYPFLILAILILAGGLFSYQKLKTGLFPDITFPKIKVIADAGQQPVDKMMTAVTIPLENALRRTEGLQYIKSTTSRGSCEISVFLDWDMDINIAKSQIESYINQSQGSILPNTNFLVEKMNPSILPVIGYSLEGDNYSLVDLKKIAKYQIKPYLAASPGVADVVVVGGKEKEYQVVLDPVKFNKFGIGISTVKNAIVNANILQSNGYIADHNRLYLTLTDNAITQRTDLENIPIINTSSGFIRLKDIASIDIKEVKEYVRILANGKNTPLIAIVKQSTANLMEVTTETEKKIDELASILPKGIYLKPCYKQADFVGESIRSIKDVLWIGLLLALFVVVYFLKSISASLLVLFSIPISLSLTLIGLDIMGYSFNIMTLGAIAAAIGLMIDDVVIVIEQIHKIREENLEESIGGIVHRSIQYLFPAMIGSSLSTLVIFIPFILMTGVAGAYFKVMAFTMVIALIASFVVSWLVLPVLAIFLSKGSHKKNIKRQSTKWIHFILRRPIIGVLFAFLCVLILLAVPSRLTTGFLPEMDEGSIVLDFNSPPGTTLEETNRMLSEVNHILNNQEEVEAYSARMGTQMGFFITEPNRGDYLIKLKDSKNKTTTAVADEIRQKLEMSIPQLTVDFGQVIGDMLGDLMSSVQPIEIKVFGSDVKTLQILSKQIAAEIKQVDGTVDVNDGVIVAGPTLSIIPNTYTLSQLGLTANDLQLQLQTQIEGMVVSTIYENEQIVPIRLIYSNIKNLDIDNIRNTKIILPNGSSIAIDKVASITLGKGVAEINRENQKSMGVITARLDQRDLGSAVVEIKNLITEKISIPSGYHIAYGGAYKEQQQAFQELLLILISAFLLVFMIILCLFRKLIIAIMILIIGVLGVAGCLLSLFITGTPLNVGSYTGIIMIVGILGENSIFTYLQFLETDTKWSVLKRIEYAIAERLRPKLMTTTAAMMALIPLALGIGTGAQLHQPLAIAVIGGLLFALPLLLVVLPTMLEYIEKKRK
ncbi:efflux RND transporter permease subunit [Galbibacter orientalis]|uniref:efflux RND transporter permease subunit n=1 Tax=Galbibacter orientalis TaxID=453852 RepID=UPI0030802DF2